MEKKNYAETQGICMLIITQICISFVHLLLWMLQKPIPV